MSSPQNVLAAHVKQSDFGPIPTDWEVVEAFDYNPFITSGSRGWSKHYSEGGAPFIRIGNLSHDDIYPDLSDLRYVDVRPDDPEAKRTKLEVGDILISITADIGAIGFVSTAIPTPAYINQHIACLRLPGDMIDSHFVAYFLGSSGPQRRFSAMVDVGAKSGLNLTTIGELQLLVPPHEEQKAIAAALSDADALIEGLESLIAKKRAIKQGAMQELLTGRRRLAGFSGEWEIRQLGDVLRFQVGFPFSSTFFETQECGIRLVKNRDLKADDSVFYFHGPFDRAYLVQDGDVLIGMDGDFRPCLWRKGEALLNQRIGRIIPSHELSKLFAYYCLVVPLKVIENETSGTTVKHLSHSDVEEIEMPLPSLPEQRAIAEVLLSMDTELEALTSRLTKARQIKHGMMQELLTGRIRLI